MLTIRGLSRKQDKDLSYDADVNDRQLKPVRLCSCSGFQLHFVVIRGIHQAHKLLHLGYKIIPRSVIMAYIYLQQDRQIR